MTRISIKLAALVGALLGAGLALSVTTSSATAHPVDYVWPGYGGFTLYHNYNLEKPWRPYHRHYYPRRWGGYAFSAPYFVPPHHARLPYYVKLRYGNKQKHHWYREHRNYDRWEWRRW